MIDRVQMITKNIWNIIENAVVLFFRILSRTLGLQLSNNMIKTGIQFVKFGIIGISNTAISYIIYTICLLLFRNTNFFSKADYLIAQGIAFILSVLWSFYWNNKMVFILDADEERSIWKTLLRTYISYSFTGLFLNSILLVLWVQWFHISEFIAPIFNLLISVPLNFLINKFWTFKKKIPV